MTPLRGRTGVAPNVSQYNPEEKNRLRRLRTEQAINLAMQGKWQEAAETNRTIIAMFPDDAESYNRLGKALAELEQYRDSHDAYSKASALDPSNTIAQKNKKRLAVLAERQTAAPRRSAPSQSKAAPILPTTFIEETGKSGTASLNQLASTEVLNRVIPGDTVILKVDGNSLKVESREGEYIGTVEPKMGLHLSRFIQAGNRYAAAVTVISEKQVKIIIHETHQDASMVGRPSFTSQGMPAPRPYVRSTAVAEDDEENAYEPDFGEESEVEESDNEDEVPFEDDDDDDSDEEG